MKKLLLFLSPLILFIDVYLIGIIFDLLSAKSDIAVLVGIGSISLFAYLNYLLIRLVIKASLKNKIK